MKFKLIKEALHGQKEIDEYNKLTKEIGLKTLGDIKRFKKENGGAELDDLRKVRKELGSDFKIKENKDIDLDEALGLKESVTENELPYDKLTSDERYLAKYIFDNYGEYGEHNKSYYLALPSDKDDLIEDIIENYDEHVTEKEFNNVLKILENVEEVPVYENHIELSNRKLLGEINPKGVSEDDWDSFNEWYWQEADRHLEDFESEYDVGEVTYSGRGSSHILVNLNVQNFINYDVLHNAMLELQDAFVGYVDSYDFNADVEYDRRAVEQAYGLEDGELDGVSIRGAETIVGEEQGALDSYITETLKEDTIKQNGKWVNKGKEGTHGTFKTKKAADAQRKAMFANGFKESLFTKEECEEKYVQRVDYYSRRYAVKAYEKLKELGVPVKPMSWGNDGTLMFDKQSPEQTAQILDTDGIAHWWTMDRKAVIDKELNESKDEHFTKEEQEEFNIDEDGNSLDSYDEYVHCEWCGDVVPKDETRKELNLGRICRYCQDALVSRGEKPVYDDYGAFEESLKEDYERETLESCKDGFGNEIKVGDIIVGIDYYKHITIGKIVDITKEYGDVTMVNFDDGKNPFTHGLINTAVYKFDKKYGYIYGYKDSKLKPTLTDKREDISDALASFSEWSADMYGQGGEKVFKAFDKNGEILFDELSEKLEESYGDDKYFPYNPELGWTEDDIELHKSIDWKARNWQDYEVAEDEFKGKIYAYGKDIDDEKEYTFHKFLRANPVYPPYYRAVDFNDKELVGPMYDGRNHGSYGIHDRYETQKVYDMLSEDLEIKLPTEVTYDFHTLVDDEIDISGSDYNLDDEIANRLSDDYGYCMFGFDYDIDKTSGDVYVHDIKWDLSENLKEDWAHFEFKSGSNPYITKTEEEKERMLKKYGDKVKEIKTNFYEIDDIKKDGFIEEDLYHTSYPTIEDMFMSVGVEKVFDENGYFTPEAEEKYEEVGKKFFDNIDEFDKLCSEEHCFKETINESEESENLKVNDFVRIKKGNDIKDDITNDYVGECAYIDEIIEDEYSAKISICDSETQLWIPLDCLEKIDESLDEKLIQGKSEETVRKNTETEIKAGKSPKQAYAIAKSIQKKNMKENFDNELPPKPLYLGNEDDYEEDNEGPVAALDWEYLDPQDVDDSITTYKGYPIEHNFYGEDEYTVQYLGDDIWFKTEEDAKEFIDGIVDDINEAYVKTSLVIDDDEIEQNVEIKKDEEEPFVELDDVDFSELDFKPSEEKQSESEEEIIEPEISEEDVEELNKLSENVIKEQSKGSEEITKQPTLVENQTIIESQDEEEPVVDYVNENFSQTPQMTQDVKLEEVKGE